jgi:hypothetical protein
MSRDTRIVLRVDTYTRVCLTVIAVLLAVLIGGLWAETDLESSAFAQDRKFADKKASEAISEGRWGTSSSPQKVVSRELKGVNARLDRLVDLLASGRARVRIEGPLPLPQEADDHGRKSKK